MSSIDVSLPEELKEFVESEAAAAGYESPAAYIRELLRSLWKHRANAALEANLIAASESGPPVEVTPEFWDELRARVRRRAGALNP